MLELDFPEEYSGRKISHDEKTNPEYYPYDVIHDGKDYYISFVANRRGEHHFSILKVDCKSFKLEKTFNSFFVYDFKSNVEETQFGITYDPTDYYNRTVSNSGKTDNPCYLIENGKFSQSDTILKVKQYRNGNSQSFNKVNDFLAVCANFIKFDPKSFHWTIVSKSLKTELISNKPKKDDVRKTLYLIDTRLGRLKTFTFEENILKVCVARDETTALIVTRNKIVIIDNPFI